MNSACRDVLCARGWQHHDMDQAQGLPGNGHGSVWSEVMTGQRQHDVATPRRKKWQPVARGPGCDILFGGGKRVYQESTWWAWKDTPCQVEGEEEHSSRREQRDQKLSGRILPRDCEGQGNGGVETLQV